jgi:hypothetical protein
MDDLGILENADSEPKAVLSNLLSSFITNTYALPFRNKDNNGYEVLPTRCFPPKKLHNALSSI